jgi:hypothetical protein
MKAKAVGWIEGDEVHWLRDQKPEHNTTLYVEIPAEVEDREPIGYTLEPIYSVRKGFVATAAFILCNSCGGAISSHSGPKYNAICLNCAEHFGTISGLKKDFKE